MVKPKTGGRIWSKAFSVFYKKDGTFNRLALVILIIRALAADVIPINIAMITYTCKQISISPAVVQSFTTLSSFMTAVGFYYSYGERLTYQHIAGMLMIVGSVLIVAVSKSMSHNDPQTRNYDDDLYLTSIEGIDESISTPSDVLETHSVWYILIPYFFAFTICVFLTIGSYTTRYSRVAGYPSIQFSLDFSCLAGFFYLIGFIYECIFGPPYQIECIITMTAAGLSIVLAFICLNAALLSGKGALAMAISQTQSFFWLLLEMTFSFRLPYFYEAMAMTLGIAGAVVITVAKK